MSGNFEFRPTKLKSLYRAYFFIVWIMVLLPVLLISTLAPFIIFAIFLTVELIITFFVLWWISAYYKTVVYRIGSEAVEHERGVWFKKETNVPFNRITNVDTSEGPVSRIIGCGSVNLQTAGNSAQTTSPELSVNGIENFKEIRDQVLEGVRGFKSSSAVETYEEDGKDSDILGELKKIRKILERE
ncbi:MAG: PH domain-containing protein [Candidatus Aenigmatarchaeota archaeon]